jgi:hypothetical protein
MTPNVPVRSGLPKSQDVPSEQEERAFLKAIELGLMDVRAKRTVSLSDARTRLGLNPSSHLSL